MKSRVARWVVVAAILLLKSPLDAQQQSAVIRGFVSGADGTPAVGVSVMLLDQLGSRVAGTQTESTGRFRLEDVPPGTYTVFAEAPQQSDARVITVGAALPVDVVLTLAARVTESVVVQGIGDAPAVATRMTIAGDTLRQVPARHPSRGVSEQLATLAGWAGEDNGLLHVRGVDDGVLYVEDGVPVYDRVDAVFGIAPDPAAVSSMNVLTGYIPPEYGLKSGAVVELRSATTPRTGWAGSIETGIGSEVLRLLRAVGARNVGSRAVLGVGVAAERSDRFLDPVHPDNLHNGGGVFSGSAHSSAGTQVRA